MFKFTGSPSSSCQDILLRTTNETSLLHKKSWDHLNLFESSSGHRGYQYKFHGESSSTSLKNKNVNLTVVLEEEPEDHQHQ